mmetsp:Transcript_59418/g.119237  ORF Transcript_59418/g.119237 Transcript_59418/m.119237 type:complete len:100 (-) Transcript_59418:59-358(-)
MLFITRYYIWVNIAGFVLAAGDKFIATTSAYLNLRRRVAESTLLLVAAAGGFPGESVAFALFNHKTRKQSFRHAFVFATAVHLLLFLFLWRAGFMVYLF